MAQQPKKSALSWKLKAILALAAAMLCGRIFVEAIDSLSGQQSLVDLIATIAVVLFLAVSAVGLNKFFKSLFKIDRVKFKEEDQNKRIGVYYMCIDDLPL